MSALKLLRQGSAVVAMAALLAGCASTPAPVTNYSFGGSSGQPAAATTSAQPAAAGGGVQTFGLGGHANGKVGAGGYVVAPGDTLYSIAFAHGIDFRTLAAQNDIPPPYTIHPGQVLKLRAAPPSQPSGTAVTGAAPAAAGVPPAAPQTTPRTTPAQPSSAPVFGPVTTQTMTATGVVPAENGSVTAAPAATAPAPTESVAASPAPPQPVQPVVTAVPTPPPGASRNVAGISWQWPASGKVVGGFQSGSGGDGAGLDIAGNLGDPVRAAAAGTVVYSGNGLIGYGELVIIKHNDTFLSAYGHNSKRLVKEGDHVGAGQEIALMGASGAPRVELHFEIRKDGKPVDPLGYLPGR